MPGERRSGIDPNERCPEGACTIPLRLEDGGATEWLGDLFSVSAEAASVATGGGVVDALGAVALAGQAPQLPSRGPVGEPWGDQSFPDPASSAR